MSMSVHVPAPREAVKSMGVGAGRFIVLEGLSATGKSTLAPLLAERINAVWVQTLLPGFGQMRQHIDGTRLVMARLHFWMMANYAVSELIRDHLAQGHDVVVESYFYRTLATHAALGVTELPSVDWERAVKADRTILLTVDEPTRLSRLAERERDGGLSYWSRLEESHVEITRATYASFGLDMVDTFCLEPADVVAILAELLELRRVGHA